MSSPAPHLTLIFNLLNQTTVLRLLLYVRCLNKRVCTHLNPKFSSRGCCAESQQRDSSQRPVWKKRTFPDAGAVHRHDYPWGGQLTVARSLSSSNATNVAELSYILYTVCRNERPHTWGEEGGTSNPRANHVQMPRCRYGQRELCDSTRWGAHLVLRLPWGWIGFNFHFIHVQNELCVMREVVRCPLKG
jgi:hypothetical protein